MKTKNYVDPSVKMVRFYAECAGINIGSGNTIPEECDANESYFEEEQSPIRHHSVWDN